MSALTTKSQVRNSLTELMSRGEHNLLNIYCTAGFPRLNDTSRVINALEVAGADIIEIGMPYSDPLADGPTIQQSNMVALDNGMTLKLLFDQLDGIDIKAPIILMGYFNPILQYGVKKFCSKCADVGISGLIVPDLPPEYFVSEFKSVFDKYNLSFICLVTPLTSESRIRDIDKISSGFIYAVTSSSTTGTKSDVGDVDNYLRRLKSMNLRNAFMTGFNIHDKESFDRASKYSSGGIIGSAFIRELVNAENLEEAIFSFVKNIRP